MCFLRGLKHSSNVGDLFIQHTGYFSMYLSFPLLSCFIKWTIAQDTEGSQELATCYWTFRQSIREDSDSQSDKYNVIYPPSLPFVHYLFFDRLKFKGVRLVNVIFSLCLISGFRKYKFSPLFWVILRGTK